MDEQRQTVQNDTDTPNYPTPYSKENPPPGVSDRYIAEANAANEPRSQTEPQQNTTAVDELGKQPGRFPDEAELAMFRRWREERQPQISKEDYQGSPLQQAGQGIREALYQGGKEIRSDSVSYPHNNQTVVNTYEHIAQPEPDQPTKVDWQSQMSTGVPETKTLRIETDRINPRTGRPMGGVDVHEILVTHNGFGQWRVDNTEPDNPYFSSEDALMAWLIGHHVDGARISEDQD